MRINSILTSTPRTNVAFKSNSQKPDDKKEDYRVDVSPEVAQYSTEKSLFGFLSAFGILKMQNGLQIGDRLQSLIETGDNDEALWALTYEHIFNLINITHKTKVPPQLSGKITPIVEFDESVATAPVDRHIKSIAGLFTNEDISDFYSRMKVKHSAEFDEAIRRYNEIENFKLICAFYEGLNKNPKKVISALVGGNVLDVYPKITQTPQGTLQYYYTNNISYVKIEKNKDTGAYLNFEHGAINRGAATSGIFKKDGSLGKITYFNTKNGSTTTILPDYNNGIMTVEKEEDGLISLKTFFDIFPH